MKTSKYILILLAALGLTTACQDRDWDAPDETTGMESYGNQNLVATNVKTIAEVKNLFKNEINNNGLKEIKEPMQIMGLITGNDESGNIYNALYIQDNTGALAISVGQGGLQGPFSVGQCVLIELNGLYIGGYGKQGQIGTTYTNPNKEGATPQVGRMSRYIWQSHYKLIPPIAGLIVSPIECKWNFNSLDLENDCAKLVTLRGVMLAEADGTAVYAPDDGSAVGGSVNRTICYDFDDEDGSPLNILNVVLRTSTYADFAKSVMPTTRVDITGIATRYNDVWQLLMRTDRDIVPSTTPAPPTPKATGSGTADDPFNVAGIIKETKELASGKTTEKEFYAKGYVVGKPSFVSKYSSMNYYISDDKEGNLNSFYVYSGQGLGNTKFTSEEDLKAGDEVVVCGKVTNFNGTIEFQSQNYIVSLNGKTK